MAASAYNSNEIYAKELEDELMKYTKRDEENKADLRLTEKTREVKGKTDEVQSYTETEVNIIDCTKSFRFEPVAAEYQETTESSSSFNDCDSGCENNTALGDSEASSSFFGDAPTAQDFVGLGEKFGLRKKKLTEQWRSYIHPLIWRCKWVELQVKKLETQAQMYEKELEACNKRKQIQLEDSELVDGVKSVPFSHINFNGESGVLMRKKRRRSEEAVDVAEYMSHHNLFSYYENKKFPVDGAFKRNEVKNPGKVPQKLNIDEEFWADDSPSSSKREDADNYSERLLWKIFSLQSQVGQLKSKIGRVTSQNAEIIAWAENLSFSMPSSTSTPNNGEGKNHTIDCAIGPENSVSSHGDTVPDDKETVVHARFANVYRRKNMNSLKQRSHIITWCVSNLAIAKCFQLRNGSSIGNAKVKEEPVDSRILNDGLGNTNAPIKEEQEQSMCNQRPHRVCSIPTMVAPSISKRKRGRRKGVGRRIRRSSA